MRERTNVHYQRFNSNLDDSQGNHLLTRDSVPNEYSSVDVKDVPIFELWKRSLVYLISDIKKKPGTFKIGVFTIILVCAFIVMLDSVMALAPLFIQNPNGDIDATASIRYPNVLIEGHVGNTKSESFEDYFQKGVDMRRSEIELNLNNQDDKFDSTIDSFFSNPSQFITNVTLVEGKT